MKLRDYVIEQISHHETNPIPYTIRFSDMVANNLDLYYGNSSWKQGLLPYILRVTSIKASSIRHPCG
jgi:hypothetical protein